MMILYGNIGPVKFFSLLGLRFRSKKPAKNALFSARKYKAITGVRVIFVVFVHIHYLFNAAHVGFNWIVCFLLRFLIGE